MFYFAIQIPVCLTNSYKQKKEVLTGLPNLPFLSGTRGFCSAHFSLNSYTDPTNAMVLHPRPAEASPDPPGREGWQESQHTATPSELILPSFTYLITPAVLSSGAPPDRTEDSFHTRCDFLGTAAPAAARGGEEFFALSEDHGAFSHLSYSPFL